MKVTEEVVREIAELTQIKVRDEDVTRLAEGMKNILELAEEMQNADTEGLEPVANPLDAVQRLRPDIVTETNRREELQKIAPHTQDGLYLVPRVVE